MDLYFGPSDSCDFSISAYPGTDYVVISNNSMLTLRENINVTDLKWPIKPYNHPVYIKVINSTIPRGVFVLLEKKAGGLPLKNINMTVKIDSGNYIPGEYEILIQATGEDDKRRNCTYFLSLEDGSSTIDENFSVYGSLPVGRTPDGYVDKEGQTLSRSEWMKKYKNDPEDSLDKREKGNPKSKELIY